jgi:energy-converting hydrogenase B subunit D
MEQRHATVAQAPTMTTLLLILHCGLGLLALQARNLLVSILALSALSLMSALLFFLLDAPDVALTEAAVGAGVTGFLFVWFIRKTSREDRS